MTDTRDQVIGAMHSVLMALAGRLDDGVLATGQALLAEGWVDEVASTIVEAALDAGVVLSWAEHDVLLVVLSGRQHDLDLLSVLVVVDEEGVQVAPQQAGVVGHVADVADLALIEGLRQIDLASSAWRADVVVSEDGVKGVWLVELEGASGVDLARATGALQRCLTEAGVVAPALDVISTDGWAPSRALSTLSIGRRVWPEYPDLSMRVAQVYDGVDADGRPYFDPSRPRLDGERRQRVLGVLGRGAEVVRGDGSLLDVVDQVPEVVPNVYRTDGRWIWHDAVAYHLERHGIAPVPELLRHLEGEGDQQRGAIDQAVLLRALEALRKP